MGDKSTGPALLPWLIKETRLIANRNRKSYVLYIEVLMSLHIERSLVRFRRFLFYSRGWFTKVGGIPTHHQFAWASSKISSMAISPNIIPRVPDFGCIMATTVDLLLFLITEVSLSLISLITVWYPWDLSNTCPGNCSHTALDHAIDHFFATIFILHNLPLRRPGTVLHLS